jgi:hypothetical protein
MCDIDGDFAVIHRPGTVVMQYVCDAESVIGVVIGDEHRDRLPDGVRESYSRVRHHVLLVLKRFERPRTRLFSVFYEGQKFPLFMLGDRRIATETSFLEERALCAVLDADQATGLIRGASLRRAVFRPSDELVEVLLLIEQLEHYKRGGQFEDRPRWPNLLPSVYEGEIARIFWPVLQKYVPVASTE